MNTLSLFNGMSVCRMALQELNIDAGLHYSSEIDKFANKATEALFPDTIQLGDVTQWRDWSIDWASIELVTGGFPCQAWSTAGKQLGDKDERGMLFWTMLDIMKHVKYHNPQANFLIENVKMKKEFEQYITTHTEKALGKVNKVLINSALVSAQNRHRYYWTSFEVGQPEDKGVVLNDIIEHDCTDINSPGWHRWFKLNKSFQIKKTYSKICSDDINGKSICMTARQFSSWNGNFIRVGRIVGRKINSETGKREDYNKELPTIQYLEPRNNDKSGCLTTVQKDNVLIGDYVYRNLTPRECMRLQTIPKRYIDTLLSAGISNTQLYKMTGNGWTLEVITHILKSIKG